MLTPIQQELMARVDALKEQLNEFEENNKELREDVKATENDLDIIRAEKAGK